MTELEILRSTENEEMVDAFNQYLCGAKYLNREYVIRSMMAMAGISAAQEGVTLESLIEVVTRCYNEEVENLSEE